MEGTIKVEALPHQRQGFDLMNLIKRSLGLSSSELDIVHNVAEDITDGRAEQG
jgi:hypothetical protein